MRRLLAPLVIAIALTLAGCGGNVGKFVSVATGSIPNPVDATDIHRAKIVYGATLSLADDYRSYCWPTNPFRSYRALMADPIAKALCEKRRPVWRAIQRAAAKAGSAIRSAEKFVRDNPTISAASAISAARTAVRRFQNAVPRVR